MRTREEISTEIEAKKLELASLKGTSTEVYTRIVGYYRPVQNWNSGKKEEYKERVEFCVENGKKEDIVEAKKEEVLKAPDTKVEEKDAINIIINDKGAIKKYKLFYSDNCPGCPPVKNYLKQVSMFGEEINASTKEGLEEAIKHNITGTPTVLFLDEYGSVVNKAHTPSQIERLIA